MYLAGFGNHHQSEAIPGALPQQQNSPQHTHLGLYAEQLSGSAFSRPRHTNLRSWLYRILPSVVHGDYEPYSTMSPHPYTALQAPNPMRWSPLPMLNPADSSHDHVKVDFIDGLFHIAGNGLLNTYLYQANISMTDRYFNNHDGEMLLVPYEGTLNLHTECGSLTIAPGQIAVIPRGFTWKVQPVDGPVAGYVCENSAAPLTLPEMGIMGANALANPRHFLYPQAAFEKKFTPCTLLCKHQQQWWQATMHHSPLNVVAWHGNYAPYSYDLSLFNTINTVSFDHPDPSIFTVLTSESDTKGVANLDFVIFPPRWMVAERTFRPPYFHRNIMSEFMGLIRGEYDAKKTGFCVGGYSIHNCMTAHGPDTEAFTQASLQMLQPEYYANTLACMFESKDPWQITEQALHHPSRQKDYSTCWQGLQSHFSHP